MQPHQEAPFLGAMLSGRSMILGRGFALAVGTGAGAGPHVAHRRARKPLTSRSSIRLDRDALGAPHPSISRGDLNCDGSERYG